MNEEVQKKAIDMLEALAEKLGTTLEHLWGVLLRQALVEGIYSAVLVVVGALTLGVLIYAYILVVRAGRNESKRENDPFFQHLAQIAGGLAFCLFGTLVCDLLILKNVHTALICFINPEYWAIREVARLF